MQARFSRFAFIYRFPYGEDRAGETRAERESHSEPHKVSKTGREPPKRGRGLFFGPKKLGRRNSHMKIDDWRRKIDAIDTALLHLLNLRTELALEVGRLKSEEGVSLRALVREQEILTRMRELNPGPLDNEAVSRIYQLILDLSIRTQELDRYGKPDPL